MEKKSNSFTVRGVNQANSGLFLRELNKNIKQLGLRNFIVLQDTIQNQKKVFGKSIMSRTSGEEPLSAPQHSINTDCGFEKIHYCNR